MEPTRQHWVQTADLVLDGAWKYSAGSLINPPGKASASGQPSDGLEGFARTFLLAAYRIRGASGIGVAGLITRYTDGIRLGTDPASRHHWPTITKTPQARVEAASLALGLAMTRLYIWDRLDDITRQRLRDWLRPGLAPPPYDNNWHLFSLVVAGFLASVGDTDGTDAAAHRALERIDQWYDDGWYSDGSVTDRAYDSYNALALHYYPVLYGYLFDKPEILSRYGSRLHRFIATFALTFDANGTPMFYGRSLTYRFAPVGALWLGSLTGHTPLEPGQTRRIASNCLQHFLDRGALTDGYFPLGWYTAGDTLIQPYSGPSSPYWTAKAFAALLLPDDHPEWQAPPRRAPVELHDAVTPLGRTGVIAHSTAGDGIARIHNHGSDNHRSRTTATANDDPLYSQTAYSTRTAPAVESPYSNAFGLLINGRITERGPITPLAAGPAWAASRQIPQQRRRWIGAPRMDFPELRRHVSAVDPVAGASIDHITCCEGHLEVRIWRVRGAAGRIFQVSGWPVAHRERSGLTRTVSTRDRIGSRVSSDSIAASLHSSMGFTVSTVVTTPQRTPFGEYTSVTTLSGPCDDETLFVAIATLADTHVAIEESVTVTAVNGRIDIIWPDGRIQSIALPD